MYSKYLFGFFLITFVYSNHIGYVGVFTNFECSGDPEGIFPLFEGENNFCHTSSADSCFLNIGALIQPDLLCEIRTFVLAPYEIGIVELFGDGSDQIIPYGFCIPGASFGCSIIISPPAIPFVISPTSDEDSSLNNFVGYYNYHDDLCSDSVQFRAPIFEGENMICRDTSASTCIDSLQGFTLPNNNPNRDCQIVNIESIDDCSLRMEIDDDEIIYNMSECYTDNLCNFSFSIGNGIMTPCVFDDDEDYSSVITSNTYTNTNSKSTSSSTSNSNSSSSNGNILYPTIIYTFIIVLLSLL